MRAHLLRELKRNEILANSLRLHPLSGMDQLTYDWGSGDQVGASDEVSFDEFLEWQTPGRAQLCLTTDSLPSLPFACS